MAYLLGRMKRFVNGNDDLKSRIQQPLYSPPPAPKKKIPMIP
jgi:hypothetical protein